MDIKLLPAANGLQQDFSDNKRVLSFTFAPIYMIVASTSSHNIDLLQLILGRPRPLRHFGLQPSGVLDR